MIRFVAPSDFDTLCTIYNHYINHTAITFDTVPLTVDELQEKLSLQSGQRCLVYEQSGKILGFAAASAWKARKAYEQTVEISIYLSPDNCGQGVGSVLMQDLIKLLKSQGIHSIISGIVMPNLPSMLLHQKFKFKKVAHFSEIGNKFGKWLDVSYWQLMI